MTPLLWFLLGGCVFSLITVVLMAMMFAAKEADDDWEATRKAWRNPVLTDEDYEFIRAAEHDAELRMRRGPYDYREGL